MRYDYRTFVVTPPRLLQEQPQLTGAVVDRAVAKTFSGRQGAPPQVDSIEAHTLQDGRLRVGIALSTPPGTHCPDDLYGIAIQHNVHAAAKTIEREGIVYSLAVGAPSALVETPELRAPIIREAIERAFPDLVGKTYHLAQDLHCEVYPYDATKSTQGTSGFALDVTLAADARSGLTGEDLHARYVSFERHLSELCDAHERIVPDRPTGGPAMERYSLSVPVSRDFPHLDDPTGLVADALERSLPVLRDAEYGFDYELDEDSVLQITLSAQPQQALQQQATEAWEVSLALSENEVDAAVESNLDDVIREARDGVDLASARAFSR